MKDIISIAILSIFSLTSLNAVEFSLEEKMYIDEHDLCVESDSFQIHVGSNIWINTGTVHRDKTGLFTYESDIYSSRISIDNQLEYEKHWKCPYCYRYWPVGKPCANKDCPSKYK